MTVKNNLLCLLCLCISLASSAQKNNRLLIEAGMSLQKVLEKRFTADAQYESNFHSNFHYEFGKKANINRITLGLAANTPNKQNSTDIIQVLGEFKYTHLRPLKQSHYLGFFVDNGNAFSIPITAWSGNNSLSYSLWASVGLASYWEKNISINNRQIIASFDAAIPLLGYVVRPAYGHPYAENFLEDGTFNFDRIGMGKYILTSGKIRSLNSFRTINTKASIAIPFGEKAHQIGLAYAWKYVHIGNDRPIWIAQHQLSIHTKINF